MTDMHRPRRTALLALAAGLALATAACGDDDGGDDTASVEITAPEDGATVSSPVTFEMSAEGIEIEPAGEVVEGAGHFHLLVDVDCLPEGEVIPGGEDAYQHFGQGQTTAELELEPGEHTVCLQVGDGAHAALDVTDTVTFTVE